MCSHMITYGNFSIEETGGTRAQFLDGIDTHDGNGQTSVELVLHDVDFLAEEVGGQAQTKSVGSCGRQ